MKKEIRIAPKNSVVLIMDRSAGEIPESMGGKLVAATPSCVAVGTLSEYDGQTLIMLSDEPSLIAADESILFDGVLSTPQKVLAVCSVLNEPLLVLDVPGSQTRVKVWANHGSEPDEIRVVVG